MSELPAYRAEHFPSTDERPWLDRDDAEQQVRARLAAGELSTEQAAKCLYWAQRGYVILERLIQPEILDEVWGAYEAAVAAGKIRLEPELAGEGDPHPGRYLNPHKKAAAFCRILKHPDLLSWIRLLTDREPRALQTITSHKGSQQAVHSDSIHMTTYPLGYLTAAWIAFEDIHPDSGPLVYHPGSHRLPYVFSNDVGIGERDLKDIGYQSYQQKYEPFIRQMIEEHHLQPAHFHARKGDVLVWHANLLHGGSTRRNLALTRKALVCHFYVKGVFLYHDLAAKRSRQQYTGTCMLRDEEGKFSLWKRGAKI